MSAGKDIKKEQAKIEGIESKALPFNENEYQDITDTLVKPSKIQLMNPNNVELDQRKSIGQVEPLPESEPNDPEKTNGDEVAGQRGPC